MPGCSSTCCDTMLDRFESLIQYAFRQTAPMLLADRCCSAGLAAALLLRKARCIRPMWWRAGGAADRQPAGAGMGAGRLGGASAPAGACSAPMLFAAAELPAGAAAARALAGDRCWRLIGWQALARWPPTGAAMTGSSPNSAPPTAGDPPRRAHPHRAGRRRHRLTVGPALLAHGRIRHHRPRRLHPFDVHHPRPACGAAAIQSYDGMRRRHGRTGLAARCRRARLPGARATPDADEDISEVFPYLTALPVPSSTRRW